MDAKRMNEGEGDEGSGRGRERKRSVKDKKMHRREREKEGGRKRGTLKIGGNEDVGNGKRKMGW